MPQRAYKYRCYPNGSQVRALARTFGCVRVVWNSWVEAFNSYDRIENPKPVYKTTTELRSETPWLQDVSAAALQQKSRDFEEYKKQYFNAKRKKKLSRPVFKTKLGRQSYRLPNQKFKLLESQIQLERIGRVKTVIDRRPKVGCKFLNVTVSKECDGSYYVSVLVEEVIEPRYEKTGLSVGIDVGLKVYATTSDGQEFENPRWFRENQARLARAQRKLSRTEKKVKSTGRQSNRRRRARLKVARVYRDVSNARTYCQHQVVNDLLRKYDTVFIEDLNIAGMVRNRRLAKSISDASWSSFMRILEYKAVWEHKTVVRVGRWFASSRLCTCGYKNSELTLKDREWCCPKCHRHHRRDLLAARNTLAEGLRITGMSSCRSRETEEQTGISSKTLARAKALGVEASGHQEEISI